MDGQGQFAYHKQQLGMGGGQYHYGHAIPMAVEDQAQFAHDYQQQLGMGGRYHGHAIPSPRYGNVAASYYDHAPASSYSYYPPGSSRPDRRGDGMGACLSMPRKKVIGQKKRKQK
jgi:hypothetical protein